MGGGWPKKYRKGVECHGFFVFKRFQKLMEKIASQNGYFSSVLWCLLVTIFMVYPVTSFSIDNTLSLLDLSELYWESLRLLGSD